MKLSELNYINGRISSELKFDPEILIDIGDGKCIPFDFATVSCNLGRDDWKIILSKTRYREKPPIYNCLNWKDCTFILDYEKDGKTEFIIGELSELSVDIKTSPMFNTSGI